nr:hypothetical protein [Tanacetum cinerariifolium]
MPKVLLLAWDRVSEINDAFGNKQCKPVDIQELFRKLFNDVQNILEKFVEYINTPSWNRPIVYYDDDEEDYIIAITPVLSTEEPDFFDSNDDSTSIDDNDFFIDDIDYVEASPPDSELVSLEKVKDFDPEDGEIDIVIETLLPFSFENEEQVFNPSILSSNLLSHRGKITFDFSENPMMIFEGDIPFLDVPFLHFYPP